MNDITIIFTPEEAQIVRLALANWDGWTGTGTITDEESGVLLAAYCKVRDRLAWPYIP